MIRSSSFHLLRLVSTVPIRGYSSIPNPFDHLEEPQLDMNHATAAAFEADQSPLKVNLGRGVYKDDKGKSWTLPSVKMAIDEIGKKDHGHEYLPFSGLPLFVTETSKFAWGPDFDALKEGRIATVQTISGTGALRIAAELVGHLSRRAGFKPTVFLPDPTYVNHFKIHTVNGFDLGQYRYYDASTKGLNLEGMLEDLSKAPKGSFVLLHACAHNPTGTDPTQEQWKQIAEVMKARDHLAFFDSAYQGFASGDPDRDAFAYRYFVSNGCRVMVAQSYAKNMGLYGQRVGALHVLARDPKETKKIMANMNMLIRPMYSNPPAYGARIVGTVFSTPEIRTQWNKDVKTMADRIIGARKALVDNLKALGSPHDWSHITRQIGMFAFSGLTESQVQKLRDMHVYMNLDGRMSISGINSGNVEYLAKSMHEATK